MKRIDAVVAILASAESGTKLYDSADRIMREIVRPMIVEAFKYGALDETPDGSRWPDPEEYATRVIDE